LSASYHRSTISVRLPATVAEASAGDRRKIILGFKVVMLGATDRHFVCSVFSFEGVYLATL
jgi:hypothetical protein